MSRRHYGYTYFGIQEFYEDLSGNKTKIVEQKPPVKHKITEKLIQNTTNTKNNYVAPTLHLDYVI
jgi:hypothetical protein